MSLKFYQNKLPYKEKQFNHIFPLDSYFGGMIGEKKEVTIADLGAGMFSTTGSTWDTTIIHLYPSDILADEYNEMLRNRGVIPVILVEKQDMENLTYGNDFFDIVHCVNALDHCNNPLMALKEMYRVCKPEGWIYLRHSINNGELRKYAYSHQWNICSVESDCLVWSRTEKFLLSDYFTRFETVLKESFIILRLRKQNEI